MPINDTIEKSKRLIFIYQIANFEMQFHRSNNKYIGICMYNVLSKLYFKMQLSKIQILNISDNLNILI